LKGITFNNCSATLSQNGSVRDNPSREKFDDIEYQQQYAIYQETAHSEICMEVPTCGSQRFLLMTQNSGDDGWYPSRK
jgi:hypothetical protein